MTLITWISIIALVLSLSGNILVNFKKKIGFIVWIASNFTWIVVNLIGEPNWPQIIMFLIYAGLNVHGYVLWSRRR